MAEADPNPTTTQDQEQVTQEVKFENDRMSFMGEAIRRTGDESEGGAPEATQAVAGSLSIDNYVKHGLGIEINKEEGTKYSGTFQMDKKHGKGKLEYEATGDSYDGEWKEGDIEGEGQFTFANGDVYTGEFEKNQMKQGIMQKANGDEYAGDFLNDQFDGYSLYKFFNGDGYCGDFKNGKMNGNGVLKIKATGEDFAGSFENGILVHGQVICKEGEYLGQFAPDNTRAYQGRGIMKFKSGDVYDGQWYNGLMHGHGTFIYAKIFESDSEDEEEGEGKKPTITANYVGEFTYGKRASGTLTYDNGDVYTGIFSESGLRETGSIKLANGDEFCGVFEEGAMKCGEMTCKNGDVYNGEYANSMYHGGGKMVYANGDVYSGEFEFGGKNGSGQLTIAKQKADQDTDTAQGDEEAKQAPTQEGDSPATEDENDGVYLGEFKDDEFHGNGNFVFPDGSEYTGRFQKGKMHGQGVLLLKDGTEMLGLWEDGDQVEVEYTMDLHEPEDGEEGKEGDAEAETAASEVPEVEAEETTAADAPEAAEEVEVKETKPEESKQAVAAPVITSAESAAAFSTAMYDNALF